MTDAERETVEAIFDVTAKALQLLRTVLAATKAGTPLDVAQIDAKARKLAALTWHVEDRLLGLRRDGTPLPPETVH